MDTTYRLTTYSPDFLEKHYEIGHHRLNSWLGARQSPIKMLRKLYSGTDFDPKTRFYALRNDEVIGFIPSKIRKKKAEFIEADMEFPLLAEGYEDVEDQLMKYAFDQLKTKGVSKVYTRASEAWGNTMELAEKYGYEKIELKWKTAQLKVENFKGNPNGDKAQEVTVQDFNEIRDILIAFRKNSKKEAQAQIDKLVSISERVTSWKIIREDGRIVGHDHLVEDILDSERARMNAIYATRDDIRDQIMKNHINAARIKGIKLIDNFFWGPTQELDGPYREYGFEVGEIWSFKKKL